MLDDIDNNVVNNTVSPDADIRSDSSSSKHLRTGYTTGTCAAAASAAAWLRLRGCGDSPAVSVCFPDGQQREIPIAGTTLTETDNDASATVVKDAGDDVDITDGARISCRVSRIRKTEVLDSDIVWQDSSVDVVLRGGTGVGRVTRRGLETAPGKSAINPVPREMITDTLFRHGLRHAEGIWLVTISIDNGEKLARKTLNPSLGIEGGLSVLGQSGIVVPCSHKAYIQTIDVLLRGARTAGLSTAVLVTGERTLKAAKHEYPGMPDTAFVRIGDFIQEALQACSSYAFDRVAVVCMPGKLAKYARGLAYTHAHAAEQSLPQLLSLLQAEGAAGMPDALPADVHSVRELLSRVAPEEQKEILHLLTRKAGRALVEMMNNPINLELVVYGYNGKKLAGPHYGKPGE